MIKKHRKASHTTSTKSSEFCVVHPDGHISDAELHEPILDNPEAEAATREIGKKAARRAGMSEAMIKKLYAAR
jgi:hypothetical protein